MRKRKQYKLVETPEAAKLRLYVVRRGMGNTNRGVAVPIGGATAPFFGGSIWVEAVLRVDDYERQLSGADDSQWGDAAGRLAMTSIVGLPPTRHACNERVHGVEPGSRSWRCENGGATSSHLLRPFLTGVPRAAPSLRSRRNTLAVSCSEYRRYSPMRRTKSECDRLDAPRRFRKCTVSFTGPSGVRHSVEVTGEIDLGSRRS